MRFIERLMPARCIDLVQRLRGTGFSGDYKKFDDVVGSYVAPPSMRYAVPAYLGSRELQTLAAFSLCEFRTVLDVGGGSGDACYLMRAVIRDPFEWTVLEIPQVVSANQANPTIRYVTDSSSSYDVVHMSGVLQYLRDPYEALRRFAGQGQWLILNRLPLYTRDRIMRQKTTLGTHPAWLFDWAKMLTAIQSVGRVVFRWRVPEDCPLIDGSRLIYSGALIQIDKPINTTVKLT